MAFLTVPELAEKYKTSEDYIIRAVARWIKSGCLVEPTHFSRRFRSDSRKHPREFNERVIAILIIRDRERLYCTEAFINGYDELMKSLKC